MIRSFIALAACAVLASCTQTKAPEVKAESNQTETYKKLFDKSMGMKDYPTAIVAAQLIMLNDSSLTSYQDSLPELYAATNNIEACSQVIDAVLARHPKEEKFLQVKALVLQEQRDVEGMFAIYRTLFDITKKLSYQYQIATIQFSMGDLNKTMATLDMLIDKGQHSKDSLDIYISEQQKQKVPILAAVLNFKGYVYAQKRDMQNAKNHFEAALREFPEFVMARRNLQQLLSAK